MTLKFEVRIFRLARKCFLRERNHFRRSINADGRTARHGAGDFRRHLAVAAADIENVLVAAQMELGDDFARPGLLHGGIRRVGLGVPFDWRDGNWGHSLQIRVGHVHGSRGQATLWLVMVIFLQREKFFANNGGKAAQPNETKPWQCRQWPPGRMRITSTARRQEARQSDPDA